MRVLAKTIQMIAWFDVDGKINPIKFKYEEEAEGCCKVIIIDKIVKRELEKLAGNLMWKFTCSSKIDGIESIYEIKYDLINGRWLLFI